MCHIILFSFPILGLALFQFFPLSEALPAYLALLLGSVFFYYKIFATLNAKVQTGREGMIGGEALVIEDVDPAGKVNFRDEIWTATANGTSFPKGGKVVIRGFQGLELIVGKPGEEIIGHQIPKCSNSHLKKMVT